MKCIENISSQLPHCSEGVTKKLAARLVVMGFAFKSYSKASYLPLKVNTTAFWLIKILTNNNSAGQSVAEWGVARPYFHLTKSRSTKCRGRNFIRWNVTGWITGTRIKIMWNKTFAVTKLFSLKQNYAAMYIFLFIKTLVRMKNEVCELHSCNHSKKCWRIFHWWTESVS